MIGFGIFLWNINGSLKDAKVQVDTTDFNDELGYWIWLAGMLVLVAQKRLAALAATKTKSDNDNAQLIQLMEFKVCDVVVAQF